MENTSRKNFIASLVGASILTPALANETQVSKSSTFESLSFKSIKECIKVQLLGYVRKNCLYCEFNSELSNGIVPYMESILNPFVLEGLIYDYNVVEPTFNKENNELILRFGLKSTRGKDFTFITMRINTSGDWLYA